MISGDVGAITRKCLAMSRAIDKAKTATLREAGLASKKAIEAKRDADTGGDGRLSNVGKGGANLGVAFRVFGDTATIRATGPWPLIESNVSGHVIRSRYVAGARRRGFVGPVAPGQFRGGRRAVMHIPGIGFRAAVRHPGTRGKHTFRKGSEAAIVVAGEIVPKKMTTTIARAFRS